ncbi:N-acetylmuramoyl-L-alanine amidase [Sporosarcina limicola]|uniref:N-acetylmuramoyl-L-alanine amidase n=1 Tax=Sporosarcina limicola TaxID=34101 RepID=A0A927REH4_9BACL|nr:N-acetylmuramoyl-L-alanine amidase [Sporosarcina limicola]MBE1554612.1 N-acetylmuramoyl-L-alanine amidase [Sporosarcina limicola]
MSKVSKWILAFILLFSTFHYIPTTYANTESVKVDTNSLNIRSGPGLTYAVTGSLKKGTQVNVTSVSGDWIQITHGNQSGWIASWLTTSGNHSSGTTSTIVSRVDQLNVRSGPSISSAVLERMSAGDKAVMTGQNGEWVSVISSNGTNGWVHSDYITQSASQTTMPQVEQVASSRAFSVSVDTLNVRENADQTSKKVGFIHRDETYVVNNINGNWVQISFGDNKQGWVYSFHGILSSNVKQTSAKETHGTVTILSDGTNIREAATTSSQIVLRANAGEKFSIMKEDGDWYEISSPTTKSAFVAKWVVSTDDEKLITETSNNQTMARVTDTLKGLTIVVDPGHGGNDRGTTGVQGTAEKDMTLLTSELLATKLKAAGANVVLTREADTYISLRKRVAISNQVKADAFISVHYDANLDSSITGFTTYYAHPYQKGLASSISEGLESSIALRNRGSQPSDFIVLRENRQNAILIELGFLSNSTEEQNITTNMFREQAAHGIYNGLLDYFNSND